MTDFTQKTCKITDNKTSENYHKLIDYFGNKVVWDKKTHCFNWVGYIEPTGYGRLIVNGKKGFAHRFAWELINGSIPTNKEMHHLCSNRACCNPEHLVCVTHQEHYTLDEGMQKRANENAAKTCCPHGHEYTRENTYIRPNGSRVCKACRREGMNSDYKKRPDYYIDRSLKHYNEHNEEINKNRRVKRQQLIGV